MTVLDFAEQMERSGLEFYKEMASRTTQDGVKKVFRLLARDQQELLAKLHRMRERYAAAEMDDGGLLDRAINIFEDMRRREESLTVSNDLEAYHMAIAAERDIVRQYLEAIGRTGNPDLKRSLMRVLALDRRELEEIEQLYDFVNAPNDSLEWGEFSNLDEFHNFGRYDDLRQGELEDPVIPTLRKH